MQDPAHDRDLLLRSIPQDRISFMQLRFINENEIAVATGILKAALNDIWAEVTG